MKQNNVFNNLMVIKRKEHGENVIKTLMVIGRNEHRENVIKNGNLKGTHRENVKNT